MALLGLILPALYVGAVVFRLFVHPRALVFRGKIALLPSPATFRGVTGGRARAAARGRPSARVGPGESARPLALLGRRHEQLGGCGLGKALHRSDDSAAAARSRRLSRHSGKSGLRRERCEVPPAERAVVVSEGYLQGVRQAFASLGADSLAEFERTIARCPFPSRRLELVRPERAAEGAPGSHWAAFDRTRSRSPTRSSRASAPIASA